ncbi:MAG: pyridoxamine 5'-phosphate oxidase, partial [Moraxellaceae bacterium]
ATVAENGWPYMQHRGGKKGFLKVLDSQTVGYADYQGNRQYLTVGNLNANSRVCLFLMDYANRRRLKIWGHAKIIHATESPVEITMLEDKDYGAKVERGIVIRVEAFDWNCSKHITPRFTSEAVQESINELISENEMLKRKLAEYENIAP